MACHLDGRGAESDEKSSSLLGLPKKRGERRPDGGKIRSSPIIFKLFQDRDKFPEKGLQFQWGDAGGKFYGIQAERHRKVPTSAGGAYYFTGAKPGTGIGFTVVLSGKCIRVGNPHTRPRGESAKTSPERTRSCITKNA